MLSQRQQTILIRILLLLALAITLYFAFTPSDEPIADRLGDKLNHVLAFAVLAILVDFSFPHGRRAVVMITALILLGVLIELIQSFLPYRQASFYDVLADVAGISIYFVARAIVRRDSKRDSR